VTDDEKNDIADKIDGEGFDYYFTVYGPDKRLKEIPGLWEAVEAYQGAHEWLVASLRGAGIETER
jgi:hypothetical protein